MIYGKKFTVIIHVYWGLDYFKIALKSVQTQTYENIEIIIVNNGANKTITDYILKKQNEDNRIKIVHFKNNVFDWDDPEIMTQVCLNEALNQSTGEYVFFISYDDLISENYVFEMVKLFENNKNCITAAGIPVSIDKNGKINEFELNDRKSNLRDEYMNGKDLVLEVLKGNKSLFASPGTIFSIRRKEFLNSGGFNRALEKSQFYGIVPFGVTGFSETAILYWRRHPNQVNLKVTKRGITGAKDLFNFLSEYEIYKRWSIFGNNVAKYVINKIIADECKHSANLTVINLYDFNIKAVIRTIKDVGFKLNYYKYILYYIFYYKKRLIFTFINILKKLSR